MHQQTYLEIFRQRWVAIAGGVVAGIIIALVFCFAIPATYTATATSFLTVRSSAGTLTDGTQFALASITSYPALATSSDVLEPTIRQLGLHESEQALADSVTATNPSTTVLVQVSANAPTAKQAALIANTVSTNLASTVSSLENTGSKNRYKVTLELRDRAQVPTSPSAPQKVIILGLGVFGGLALGLIAALLWASFDTSIRTPDDVRRASGLAVIGELPVRRFRSSRRTSHLELSLREAKITIRQANGGRVPRLLVLVPASATAGEAWIRGALARTFSDSGRKVVLVESDFGGDTAKLLPDSSEAAGFAEALADENRVLELLQKPEGERYSVLPPGTPDSYSSEFLAERSAPAVLGALESDFDLTIAQATSTSRPVNFELLAPYADGVIVLLRYGRSSRSDLGRVLSRLRLSGIRPLGAIVAGIPTSRISDLSAHWEPGDFNEAPREPLRQLSDPPAEPTPAATGLSRSTERAPHSARSATDTDDVLPPVSKAPRRTPRVRRDTRATSPGKTAKPTVEETADSAGHSLSEASTKR